MTIAIVETEHVYPPIPDRNFDWAAYIDGEICGCGECNNTVGRGPTKEAALADLIEQIWEEN